MDTRERLPDWISATFDVVRMRQLTAILERRLGGISDMLANLESSGAVPPHTHTVSDITDFPEDQDLSNYVLKSGDAMLGDLLFNDSVSLLIGANSPTQLRMFSDSADVRFILPTAGSLRFIRSGAEVVRFYPGGNIEFQSLNLLTTFLGYLSVVQGLTAGDLASRSGRVLVHAEVVGPPSLDAMFEVERGVIDPNVMLRWNETLDIWEITRNGLDFYELYDGGNLDVFTAVADGLTPASGGGTSNFLRADGAWAPAGDSYLMWAGL